MIVIHLAHDSAVLRTLPLTGSLNRWICDSLTLAQISLRETSHIPGTLSAIAGKGKSKYQGMLNINSRR